MFAACGEKDTNSVSSFVVILTDSAAQNPTAADSARAVRVVEVVVGIVKLGGNG